MNPEIQQISSTGESLAAPTPEANPNDGVNKLVVEARPEREVSASPAPTMPAPSPVVGAIPFSTAVVNSDGDQPSPPLASTKSAQELQKHYIDEVERLVNEFADDPHTEVLKISQQRRGYLRDVYNRSVKAS